MAGKKEYKVITIEEGAVGSLLLGASKVPIKKMEKVLNELGKEGWEVDFQLIENKRMMFFWDRESVIVTLSRDA